MLINEYIGYALFLSGCESDLEKMSDSIQLSIKEIFNL